MVNIVSKEDNKMCDKDGNVVAKFNKSINEWIILPMYRGININFGEDFPQAYFLDELESND